jgi:myo-inositol-1(or 4)-monophosphatase
MKLTDDSSSTDLIIESLAFAEQTVLSAGEIALRYFRQPIDVDNKLSGADFDPVTRADREVEAFLRSRLRERFPEYGVIGEEDGLTPGDSAMSWIVDPIDGTKAFISGYPTWGILLGLLEGERALAGLMYQPFTGELFSGSPAGAFLQRGTDCSRLQTRQAARLDDALLYCTHESMFANQDHLEAFRRVAGQARLQRFGGDCYSYCMLAQGLVDLVIEDTLQPYDIMPLLPIVEAAGGVVTDKRGKTPVTGGFVIAAANPQLHQQALEIINK